MHVDLYTKTILTLVALLLTVIAVTPFVHPNPVAAQDPQPPVGVIGAQPPKDAATQASPPRAAAQALPAGLQFTATPVGGIWLFDSQSGDLWYYDADPERWPTTRSSREPGHYRLTELGRPLTR